MFTYEVCLQGLDGSLFHKQVKADGIAYEDHGVSLAVTEFIKGEEYERIIAFFPYKRLIYVIREEATA